MTGFIHGRLSYEIVGAADDVYNTLGPFYLEHVYQRALEIELAARSVPFVAKKSIELRYRDSLIGMYQLDLLVAGKIVLELKATEALHPKHTSQVIQYLAMTGVRLGILLNFGNVERLEYKRVPFGGGGREG